MEQAVSVAHTSKDVPAMRGHPTEASHLQRNSRVGLLTMQQVRISLDLDVENLGRVEKA